MRPHLWPCLSENRWRVGPKRLTSEAALCPARSGTLDRIEKSESKDYSEASEVFLRERVQTMEN